MGYRHGGGIIAKPRRQNQAGAAVEHITLIHDRKIILKLYHGAPGQQRRQRCGCARCCDDWGVVRRRSSRRLSAAQARAVKRRDPRRATEITGATHRPAAASRCTGIDAQHPAF